MTSRKTAEMFVSFKISLAQDAKKPIGSFPTDALMASMESTGRRMIDSEPESLKEIGAKTTGNCQT